jgi:hypothetical protein
MKRLVIVLGLALMIGGCSVNSSDNVNIDGEDMVYFKDSRTNLCFGAVASRKAMTASTTGLGVTCVPCESVKHLIK